MKALLITENDSKFTSFKKNLHGHFFGLEIDSRSSEKDTIDYVSESGELAFFIVDASFKKDVENLLNTLMDISGHRPIVICGEDEDLKRINKGLILKNEANCVVKDISDTQRVRKVIKSAIDWYNKKINIHNDENQGALEEEPEAFIPIKLRNLYFYERFPNNLYVKISEKKYILAIEKDSEITEFQINKLMQRKIQFLYIEKDKHIAFLEKSIQSAHKFFQKNSDLSKKTVMTHLRSCALLHDYLINIGNTVALGEFIEAYVGHIITVLDKTFDIEKLGEVFNMKIESIVSKSVLSAYLSFFLIRQLGWKSTTVRTKFIFASLIQDAYVQNDELSKLKTMGDPRIVDFTEEEIRSYPDHPKQIAEIARQFTQYPDIDFLLEQHHELPNREGFPNRPHPSELQLAVCVFNLASNFATDIDGKEMSLSRIKTVFRLQYAEKFNVGNFKEPIAILKKLIKIN